MRTLNRLLLVGLIAASPLAAMAADDAPSKEPEVTINTHTEGDKVIQEYSRSGFVYAIKVTPKGGKPYFLVRADGTDANYIRSDQPDMLIPSWEIFTWK
ncbi:DUF2782 domain-containing protein [Pseudomonas zeae]|jgi:hypothetical protein|uniref:DUF2782 domain-containing protein n=3 Tax=Pseudomonas TaxID=286 RepID=A0A9E6NQM4_9PSED|nr:MULTISPECIES: DUF2782 domain-containing protein [Pseudomonas]MBF6036603.1 DUF2782 domain-containing protein [Pseudomonas neuropathica]MDX9675489.1 DUF2782 domain-containing protein [Pseudomonas zeae]PIF50409.1 uncharacterized protein DUF2782 [Pseudomonas sp. 29]QXI12089.1 DUF2782 domain-containing protein [Pseudomonas zeae]ROO10784.1 hypothetical protein BK673_07590 [Pseudomonas fluorescens]